VSHCYSLHSDTYISCKQL